MLRVLLLEDSDDDAELVRIEFEHAGIACELRRAWSEPTLLQALGTFVPDVVVSDLNLPGYHGVDALRVVQRLHPATPRVLLSGDPTDVPADIATHVLDKQYLSRLPALVAAIAAATA